MANIINRIENLLLYSIRDGWRHKTGNFVKMTSNSAPAPFQAKRQNPYGSYSYSTSNYYYAFDGNTGTSVRINTSKSGSQNGYADVRLDFHKTIRIVKMTVNASCNTIGTDGASGLRILGPSYTTVKEVNLTNNSYDFSNQGDGYIEANGLEFYCRTSVSGQSYYGQVNNVQITDWYEEG